MSFSPQGRTGVAIAKTAQTITAGNAANVIEKLADYLTGLRY